MEYMFIIGITGGIGSGKSLVCEVLRTFGMAVFSADAQVKALYEENDAIKAYLVDNFGASVYIGSHLQTKILAKHVFSDKYALKELNSVVYPELWRSFERWCGLQDWEFVLMDAALLCESGFYKQMMFIVNIYAPKALRIARILRRNPEMTAQDVEQRMQFQWINAKRRRYADFTIRNDGQTALLPQILMLHEMLKARNGTQ